MKIGVLSDTHLNGYNKDLADFLHTCFRDADLIVHAGDVVAPQVLDMFGNKEVKVVYGNMDPIGLRKRYPEKAVFEAGGFRFALVHDINKIKGWGMSAHLPEKIARFFGRVDCLIHGHTHDPAITKQDGIFLFNPGSATDNRYLPFNTVGIIDIQDSMSIDILEIA